VPARAVALLLLVLASWPAAAHDPSAWGGMFRSRDFGETWFPSDAGLFTYPVLQTADISMRLVDTGVR